MLTPDQIEAVRLRAGQLTDPVVEFLISDIAERIAEAGQLTSTAAYQVWRAQQLGLSQRQLKKELRKRLKASQKELEKLMTQAAEVGYDFDISRFPYVQAVPFAENETLQKIVGAAIEQAEGDFVNLTQTMGFVTHDGVATELTEAYQKSCDFAFEKVITGAQDYQSAIREATKGLAEKGILTLDYESGVHRSVEAAVRANMMGGLNNMSREIKQRNHDDLGCDGWEISAHEFSAPDHEPFQGRQYSDEEYAKIQAMLVRDFETFSCHHDVTGIIMGVNEPQYTEEQLEEMRRRNEEGFIIDGKHYTGYQATQRQRRMERSIRDRKRRILIDEKLGDTERLPIDQTRYVVLRDEYRRFSKAAGLRTQQERMNVPGFGPKQDRAADKLIDNVAKMATTADESKNDWSEAVPRAVTKEEKSALIAYAADRGIKVPGLNNFDGDPDLLKAQIDALSRVSQQLPTGKRLVLSVGKSLSDEDFAETVGNHITVNRKALRNRGVTEANLAAGGVFASSQAEGIVIHEYGHVIAAAKGNKGVEIAQKACYNILGKNLEMGNILKLLRKEVSPYSTTYYAKRNSLLTFDPSRYKEIIPEILAKNSLEPNELTAEVVKILKEML